MTQHSPVCVNTISHHCKAAFPHYLRENPSNHRISQAERANLIDWLTNPHRRPSSQPEFSRRNYARKTFSYDEENDDLFAVAKKDEEKNRRVVTEDMIVDIVETVHQDNGHAGWDATWKDVSKSYYGILRSDVIFLLKQCRTCAANPRKRPKGSLVSIPNPFWVADLGHDSSPVDDVSFEHCSKHTPNDEEAPGKQHGPLEEAS